MSIASLKPRISTIDTRQGSSAAVERIRGWKLQKIRERVMLRDGYSCCECGRVTVDGLVDHKTPLHMGGAESDENRQWLCPECHEKKNEREKNERYGCGY